MYIQTRIFSPCVDYRYDFLFHWAAETCSITKQDVIDSLLQENLVMNRDRVIIVLVFVFVMDPY